MKKKVLFVTLGIFILASVLIYAYGTVKLLSVTDYGGGSTTSNTYYYFQQSGQCFVSTLVNDSQGAYVQVHFWGNDVDDYRSATYDGAGGPYQIQLPVLGPGNHVTVSVTSNGNFTEYTTSDLWQWQQ